MAASFSMSGKVSRIVFAFPLLLVIGASIFWIAREKGDALLPPSEATAGQSLPPSSATTPSAGTTFPNTQPASRRTIPSGVREYQSEHYRFSLLYPENLTVAERTEGGGAMTVTFENATAAEGFQIFIVPYAEPQVSEERFRMDSPLGVRKNQQSVTIDGATGASFYALDERLGETAEVWFVHEGYLYEVTSLKHLHTWLSEILVTWKFL